MGPIQTIDEFLDLLRRRWRLIAAIAAIGMAVSVWYALSLPHVYRAAATLHVELPRVADTLAPSTVEESASRRLKTSEQRILARDNVLRMIEEFGLGPGMAGLSETQKVVAFREGVEFEWLEPRAGAIEMEREITGVVVTADGPSAEAAAALANHMADQVIQFARESRRERTRTTAEFFAEREEAIAAEIDALETKIAAFKAEHELTVSGGLAFRRAELTSLQDLMLQVERDRVALEAELADLRGRGRVRVVERRIEALEAELATLDTQRAMLLERSRALAGEFQGLPQVELQLGLMEAKLERMEEQHILALQNLADAETAHRLELTEQAERIRVLESAIPPEYPHAPSRKKEAAKGVILTLVLALGAAFALDVRRPVIRTAAQMEREIGLLPVVSVPVFDPPRQKAQRPPLLGRAPALAALPVPVRRKVIGSLIAAVSLVAIFLSVMGSA